MSEPDLPPRATAQEPGITSGEAAPEVEAPAAGNRSLGLFISLLGVGIATLWILDLIDPLPVSMPRTWHRHRTLWGALGVVLAAGGWWLQRDRAQPGAPDDRLSRRRWKSPRPGRRFRQLILYSRDACHLCDDAKELLADYAEYLPEVVEVDIDSDPGLRERFGTVIPVVEIDGRERFRGRIDERLLRRLIDATPEISDET